MTDTPPSSVESTTTAPPPPPRGGRTRVSAAGGYAWKQLYNYLLLVALLVTVIFFTLIRPTAFPTLENLGSILTSGATLVLISLAAMLPLVVNQFDLTPGYMATLGAILAAGLLSFNGWDPYVVIIACVLACFVVGTVSGLLVAYGKLNSLIVTLGVGSLLFGFAQLYSNGQTIFQGIPRSFTAIGQTRLYGIPLPFIYAMVVAVVIWYVLEYRAIGRRMYAIGGSEEGARLVGVRVDRIVLGVFIASACLAGFAGVIETTRVGSANSTGLQGQLLPAFTAAFLGATSIKPGQYNVWGTVLAVYLLKTATTGMFMLGIPSFFSDIFNGLILLVAIVLAKLSSRHLAEAH